MVGTEVKNGYSKAVVVYLNKAKMLNTEWPVHRFIRNGKPLKVDVSIPTQVTINGMVAEV